MTYKIITLDAKKLHVPAILIQEIFIFALPLKHHF